jgi:CubicO group peptidase (beta-lactamase class C family)
MKIKGLFILCFITVFSSIKAQYLSKEDSLRIKEIFYYFEGQLPGAIVSVISNGNEIYYKSSGLANVETKDKITKNHYFNLSSISKIYTSMAIFKLIEMKKLSMDETLKDIFPDFPVYGQKVTVKNLLSHTSGLMDFDPKEIKTNKDLLAYLYNQDSLKIEPGTYWDYSNSDYPMLASIIEKKAKTTYPKFLKKYIFKNLKVSKTQFFEELDGKPFINGYHEKSWNFTIINDQYDKLYGEKGVFLTMDDLIKTENAIFYNINNPVKIFGKSFDRISLINNIQINYGLGWYLVPQDKENPEKTIFWIGGRDHGIQDVIVHFPAEKLTVILVINRDQMYNSIVKTAVDIGKLFLN